MMLEVDRQVKFKTVGIYLIVILALLRFLVYPLFNALEKEKGANNAQWENYRLKERILNQQQSRGTEATVVKKSDLTPYLYEKTHTLQQIQLEVVEKLNALAREKGAELVRFELLETLPGKTLSEAPVTLWFNGSPQALMNVLRVVESTRKLLCIKNMEISKGQKDHVLSLTLSAYRLEQ